jgi:hypothetical protein
MVMSAVTSGMVTWAGRPSLAMFGYSDFTLFVMALCVFAIVPTIPIVVVLAFQKINKWRRR